MRVLLNQQELGFPAGFFRLQRKQTCHGVRDDSDEESLVPHLHPDVRVLHGHDHFLHLSHKYNEQITCT